MDADLDTLATALYVKIDDLLRMAPQRPPWRPAIGFSPQISDAELVTLAVMQALLGVPQRVPLARFATTHLHHLFPYLPQQPGYNKWLRNLAATISWLIGMLARDTSLCTDDVWVIDSTPVECARSREAVRRSELAGWAEYGYCASHSRYFWELRLHLLATLHGLPVGFALTGAKADERTVLLDILHTDPTLSAPRPGQIIIGDKNYFGAEFETTLAEAGLILLRPARKGEPHRAGNRFNHRINLRHLQRSTRPRTPRRQDPQRRRPGPRPATHPRPDHRDLAQRPHRPADHTVTAGLRPLTDLLE